MQRAGQVYLSASAPESAWASEPWGHDKAYSVLLLKDETEELNSSWVPDNRFASNSSGPEGTSGIAINGVRKTVYPLKTKRNQLKGSTRCYFVDLEGEVRPGETNEIEITLPIRTGLVFSGAYLDLPDQMPPGE